MKVIKPLPVTAGTFARASTATYVSSSGLLQTAAVNVPRITFDAVTGICQGFMAEPSGTNLKAYSSQFDNASWGRSGCAITVNTATAPDGTVTMDRLVEDSTNGPHYMTAAGLTIISGSTYTFSVFVKAYSGDRGVRIQPGADNGTYFGSAPYVVFDLATGLFTQVGASVTAYTATAYGSGTWRISVSAMARASGSGIDVGPVFYPALDLTTLSPDYSGNNTSGLYVWGAQYEQGLASSYIPTAGSMVTRAADVTTGAFVYTNLTDVDAVYSAGTTYTINQRVTHDKQIWECILSPSTGNTPGSSPTYWLNRGPSNTWAAFDSQVSTASSSNLEQIYVLQPGYCSGIGIFGLAGSSIEVSILSEPGGPVMSAIKESLDGAAISNWYQYYFSTPVQETDYVTTGLSMYSLSYVTIRITGPATVQCGHVSLGPVVDLGGSQYGASIGITDYSVKKTDANGITTFVQKGYSKDLKVDTLFDKAQLSGVYMTLAGLRATPCTWITSDEAEYSQLTTFGNIRNFSINVEYYSTSLCNFDIQGLST